MKLMGIEKSNNANLGSMRKALAVMGRIARAGRGRKPFSHVAVEERPQ